MITDKNYIKVSWKVVYNGGAPVNDY